MEHYYFSVLATKMAAIGKTEIKRIVSCEQSSGRCLMAKLMQLGPYQDECNLQNSIKVDFFYDHLMYVVSKGFPWEQACSIVQFAEEFLSVATEKTVADAVCLYQAKSPSLLWELGERNYRVYTDFLFSTFFPHFQLYKFVLTQPRRQNIPKINLDVYPPVSPIPLSTAKEQNVWRYDQRLKELEDREFELLKQRIHHEEEKDQLTAEKKDAVMATVNTVQMPFSKQTLAEVIRDVLADYVQATGTIISTNIQDVQRDLEIKLEKTSLPRPSVLGPPLRYNLKSPIYLARSTKSGHPNSIKSEKYNKNSSEKLFKESPKSSPRSHLSSQGSKR